MSNLNNGDICKEINSIIMNGISKKDEEICNLKDTIRKMEEKIKSMDDSTTIKQNEKFFDQQMKRYFKKEREVDEKMEEYKKKFIPQFFLQKEIEELRNERDTILEENERKFTLFQSDNQTLKNLITSNNKDLQEKNNMIALLQDKLKSFDKNIVTKYNILKESYQSLESNSKEQISNLEKQLNEIEKEKTTLENEKKQFSEEKEKFNSFKESILELIE